MNTALLNRTYLDDRTTGELTVFSADDIELARFFVLERVWFDNERNKSCIPEGEYIVIANDTMAHPDTYRVMQVRGRSGILIHIGNYIHHSAGCLLIGLKLADLDGDGKEDIAMSTKALKEFNKVMKRDSFKLIITSHEIS